MIIGLSKWAKENGYSYRGAYNRFHRVGIPGAFINDTGRIMVDISGTQTKPEKIVTYSRVSSHAQKDDLNRQVNRLRDFCAASGMIISHEYKEIASGLNDDRKVLNKILSSNDITTIVVENKDRLTRFGFNYLSKFSGKKIVVMNIHKEDHEDLMQDLISIITSMTARYYGKRRTKNIKDRIMKTIEEETS